MENLSKLRLFSTTMTTSSIHDISTLLDNEVRRLKIIEFTFNFIIIKIDGLENERQWNGHIDVITVISIHLYLANNINTSINPSIPTPPLPLLQCHVGFYSNLSLHIEPLNLFTLVLQLKLVSIYL